MHWDWSRRRLCLLFTPESCAGDPWSTLDDALAAGLPLVQWRVKTPDRDGLRRCMDACAAREIPVIVNDHVDLAVAARAAGAHVGQDDVSAKTARGMLDPGHVLGVSTHDVLQAVAAQAAGADYIGLGPCHPTVTKGYDAGLSLDELIAVRDAVDIPVFAIGGITVDNLPRLRDAGFRNFAVSGCVLTTARPGHVVERLLGTIA
jgi:thiamine-phosphate pyrophosphorylase